MGKATSFTEASLIHFLLECSHVLRLFYDYDYECDVTAWYCAADAQMSIQHLRDPGNLCEKNRPSKDTFLWQKAKRQVIANAHQAPQTSLCSQSHKTTTARES